MQSSGVGLSLSESSLLPIGKRREVHDAPAHKGTKHSDQQHPKCLVQWRHPLSIQDFGAALRGNGGPLAPPAFDAFQVERNLQRHNNIRCVPTARCFG
jgi:hypothetical protein